MQKARVANPGPAGLLVINPKRGTKMATKRRSRSTTKRRTTAARRTPNATITRRKRRTRRANPSVFSSSRRTARRRSVSRRRNPATGGLLKQAAGLAAGITAVGFAQGFVPPIGGMTPIAVAARQAATGFLVGEGMQRFGVLRAYAPDVKLAGFALAAGTLINAYILPTVSGFLRPASKPVAATGNGNGNGNGMNDIVTLPRGEWDDYYGSTPQFRTNPGNGMGGVVTIPRRTTGY